MPKIVPFLPDNIQWVNFLGERGLTSRVFFRPDSTRFHFFSSYTSTFQLDFIFLSSKVLLPDENKQSATIAVQTIS